MLNSSSPYRLEIFRRLGFECCESDKNITPPYIRVLKTIRHRLGFKNHFFPQSYKVQLYTKVCHKLNSKAQQLNSKAQQLNSSTAKLNSKAQLQSSTAQQECHKLNTTRALKYHYPYSSITRKYHNTTRFFRQ